MSTRIPTHQLKSGLYVSGRPDPLPKDKAPAMSSRAVPYTGGDVKKSGELGRMFDIPNLPKYPAATSGSGSGSLVRSGSNSGPFRKTPASTTTTPSSSSFSGPNPLQPTGLIISGPLRRSGQLDPGSDQPDPVPPPKKQAYGPAVTSLAAEGPSVGFRVSRAVAWVVAVAVAMGLLVSVFLAVAVKKAVILAAVGGLLVLVVSGVVWNCVLRRRGLLGYLRKCPDAELRGAADGQLVKVTGVVTCGSIALESSYQRVPRCVYFFTELLEYGGGWGGKSEHPNYRFLSWGSRYSEKYVTDFYVSDLQSGLRALVKAGNGAKVAPFVNSATAVEVGKDNRELSPSFLLWLADRNLSNVGRMMRLKEGYIKEGSTISVMGVIRRHDNMLMIVPPDEPVSTSCQWLRCLLPTYVEGLVLMSDDNEDDDVIPV